MKTLQLQKNLISKLYKKERVLYAIANDKIYFTDGYTAWIIDKEENFLNLEKMEENDNIKKYIEVFENEKSLPVTNLSLLLDKKYKNKIISGECQGEKFYFNKDFLKNFENDSTLYKTTTDPLGIIYVCENKTLKGFIMPIKIDDN